MVQPFKFRALRQLLGEQQEEISSHDQLKIVNNNTGHK
uniref:Uncharacterized protein n=1 Tax=Anguilla anguilla TaxID=7936 RepID=A0A0E9XIJ1_ANGAN